MKRKDDGWSEFGGYMAAKVQKLNDQFEEGVQTHVSDMFSGIGIFVNGYTDPPDYILKQLMQQHGGRFYHYYSRQQVTHIVATTLPKSKINKLREEKVVTPQWITDSIAAGSLLNWSDYQLYADRHNSNQSVMKQFLQSTTATTSHPVERDSMMEAGALSLSEFYKKSRLHHLSTWATELSDYLQTLKLAASGSNSFDGRREFATFFNGCERREMFTITEPLLFMHIDMDCFFVSVGIRDRPDLIGKPVAVTHSKGGAAAGGGKSDKASMSEIASCSYEARRFGLKNGMLLGKAQELCPDLVTIPYSFDKYLEVSKTLYRIISRFTHDIEVGSCDELYLEITSILKIPKQTTANGFSIMDPLVFAQYLRSIIRKETSCPASCGIGANLLTCKLATKKAKPDGQFWLKSSDVNSVIKDMNVRDLPGIGRVYEDKLNDMHVKTCGDLQNYSLEKLQNSFGDKLGKRLFEQCRGEDSRELKIDRQRKSISAEMNYGIRLNNMEECETLWKKLSEELSCRLCQARVRGDLLVLKVMVRQPEASVETAKFLGHGLCDNFSKSQKLTRLTNDAREISKISINLFKMLNKPVQDLRGVGLSMHHLKPESAEPSKASNSGCIENFFKVKESRNDQNVNAFVDDTGNSNDDDDCTITEVSFECNDESEIPFKLPVPLAKTAAETQKQVFTSYKKSVHRRHVQKQISAADNKDEVESEAHRLPDSSDPIIIDDDIEDKETANFLAELGRSSFEKLLDAIIGWVCSGENPLRADVILMKHQLISMMPHRIRNVRDILIHVKHKIEQLHSGTERQALWDSCFYDIVETIQDVCRKHYGSYLKLDSDEDSD